ncbi:MAG: hypothetical protein ACYC66_03710 [Chloroflexota bacterium]
MLIGSKKWALLAAARLGYYRGHWSSWISDEIVRVRTEMIALRAARDRADVPETRRRLKVSRERINAFCDYCSRVLTVVNYTAGLDADLSWLRDPDDRPILATAVAAGIPGILVTDDRGFPLGESRGGVLFLSAADFLSALYTAYPDAVADVAEYLRPVG